MSDRYQLIEAAQNLEDGVVGAIDEIVRLSVEAKSESVRLSACNMLMDRVLGKPKERIEVDHAHYVSGLSINDLMELVDGIKVERDRRVRGVGVLGQEGVIEAEVRVISSVCEAEDISCKRSEI